MNLMNARRVTLWTILGLILSGSLAVLFWPRAIPVDFETITRGPLSVTVDDEGKTRVREVYVVSAPVAGRARRIVGNVGDEVTGGVTVLATIEPRDPTFLDRRSRRQAEARAKAAEAALTLAAAERDRAKAELDFARAELKRARELSKKRTISQSAHDRAVLETRTRTAALATANAAVQVRSFELETAQASLIEAGGEADDLSASPFCCAPVIAPVDGRILRILHKSAGIVRAGDPLLEVGDPKNLEVVVDLLSGDAVKVKVGDSVHVEQWGGGASLNGRVRRVEPFGFTKISALGVEEQRVNVVIEPVDSVDPADPADPFPVWRRLGHGYRVEVRIVIWHSDAVLKAPVGALFRNGGDWAAFVVVEGRVQLRKVKIGHGNARDAEIIDGLAEGDIVVLHPGDRVQDNVSVVSR